MKKYFIFCAALILAIVISGCGETSIQSEGAAVSRPSVERVEQPFEEEPPIPEIAGIEIITDDFADDSLYTKIYMGESGDTYQIKVKYTFADSVSDEDYEQVASRVQPTFYTNSDGSGWVLNVDENGLVTFREHGNCFVYVEAGGKTTRAAFHSDAPLQEIIPEVTEIRGKVGDVFDRPGYTCIPEHHDQMLMTYGDDYGTIFTETMQDMDKFVMLNPGEANYIICSVSSTCDVKGVVHIVVEE